MKYLLLIGFLLSFGQNLKAQEEAQNQQVQKEFLILYSGRDYAKALQCARSAAKRLQLRLDLRNLKPHPELGLSDGRKECEDNFGFYPCCLSRGYYPDGTYLSVEHSSAFPGFRSGYYIVVAAAFPKGDSALPPLLRKARKAFPDAYLKVSSVYTGCLH